MIILKIKNYNKKFLRDQDKKYIYIILKKIILKKKVLIKTIIIKLILF